MKRQEAPAVTGIPAAGTNRGCHLARFELFFGIIATGEKRK
jgi:hypothetical protein